MSITLFQCNCLLALWILIYESFGSSNIALDVEIVALPELLNFIHECVRIGSHGGFKGSKGIASVEIGVNFDLAEHLKFKGEWWLGPDPKRCSSPGETPEL